jgi:hypothetical protein
MKALVKADLSGNKINIVDIKEPLNSIQDLNLVRNTIYKDIFIF